MILLLFAKITAGPFVWLFYRFKISGRKYLRSASSCIIMVNHTSYFDALIVNMLYPFKKIYYMTKKQVLERGFLSRFFLKTFGAFEIGEKGNDHAIRQAADLVNSGKVFAITPEGRINRGEGILPFRRGVVRIAALTDAPILPVYIAKRPGLIHRQRVFIGEPIYIESLCGCKELTADEMTICARKLRNTLVKLGEKANEKVN